MKDFEREQEKFKSNQEGYKVNKKVQEEWVEKSKIMQEKSMHKEEARRAKPEKYEYKSKRGI